MKVVIFSGTSEGNTLCQFLAQHQIPAQVFVATQYGQSVMPPLPGISVHVGRLEREEMQSYLDKQTLVIDATHPYAQQVSQNILTACNAIGISVLRLVRSKQTVDDVVCVPSTEAAVNWLSEHQGKILLTVGSKELEAYTAIPDYQNRIFLRVLPTSEVLQKCESFGFPGKSIFAMQGPFSYEMNIALLQKTGAKILVTKDTGKNGGFAEKYQAAKALKVTVLMIARPTQEQGYTLEQIQQIVLDRLRVKKIPRFPLFISLAGKRVLVVGSGKIGTRRIEILKNFGAVVTVVSPHSMIALDEVIWKKRCFQSDDILGMDLVIAATNHRAVNHQVAMECHQKGIFVSVADCTQESSFYFPAICQGQGLIAGLVSDGFHHSAVASTAKKNPKIIGVSREYNSIWKSR